MAETTEQTTAGAAFFDLDRTLLSGASGPAISAALRAVGLMSERAIPGQDLVFGIFNAFGETLPSMMLTRQAASMAARWPRSKAQEAGRRAARPHRPRPALRQGPHRGAPGRRSPGRDRPRPDLVRPLADLLGIDAVIATRYGERDGVYATPSTASSCGTRASTGR
jgi:putative phosphoserine phosphatase/1-acylglycerol-3-phosphate O-acyltransferase